MSEQVPTNQVSLGCEWCAQGIPKSKDGQYHDSPYGAWACGPSARQLQQRIDFAIGELSEKPITAAAAEWVRVCVLAVLQGRVHSNGDVIQ